MDKKIYSGGFNCPKCDKTVHVYDVYENDNEHKHTHALKAERNVEVEVMKFKKCSFCEQDVFLYGVVMQSGVEKILCYACSLIGINLNGKKVDDE